MLASPAVSKSDWRIVLAFLAVAAWLVLLLAGRSGGGAVHLLFVGAVAAFPWRRLAG